MSDSAMIFIIIIAAIILSAVCSVWKHYQETKRDIARYKLQAEQSKIFYEQCLEIVRLAKEEKQ